MASNRDGYLEELHRIRASIDNVDAALIYLLSERFRFTNVIGALKAQHQEPPADPNRERQQADRLRRVALDAGLDPDFAEKLLAFVSSEVVRRHRCISVVHASTPTPANYSR